VAKSVSKSWSATSTPTGQKKPFSFT